ncbi:S8 family peptidase [Xinfangfangia sp. D13-10-4-6]|uniref:S8 family peptidase n=1 Tax=Pseudogemmobacter hezensis TaxID=2737662 RepID=UPI001552EC82|nr:S8 family peptidase [Pseudogemmobacter hezensis]NPD15115.1 S8 family peptidase [Pseudogemmobacter hezensis]
MVSDPGKPLLRLEPGKPSPRLKKDSPGFPPPLPKYQRDAQGKKLGPRFQRLADVLARDPAGLELRQDPSALAPERLLVFEARGSIQNFANAIKKVPGLELIDEEELLPSDDDKQPVAYLLVPDATALSQILRLWTIWLRSGTLGTGFAPWRDVFDCLRDLRPWGPSDRVQGSDRDILAEQVAGRSDDDMIALEIELVFRAAERAGASNEAELTKAIRAHDGSIVSRARLADIAYHAVLARLPVRAILAIIERAQSSIAGLDSVMHIRPQSVATAVEVEDMLPLQAAAPDGELSKDAILALLDGVPVAGHPLLRRHLIVEDHFGLEPAALVSQRVHGTAMASLIIHGDRNRTEAPLPRQIHCIPVLGTSDEFPQDRLIVDVIYQAIVQMRDGADPTARHVIIVNLSLGNRHRQFQGQMSPWARLLDRLAHRYGILFLVSAGNVVRDFEVPAFATSLAFEGATPDARSAALIQAIVGIQADRRLLAPGETVNGLTVGAKNSDWVSITDRAAARANVDPYPVLDTSNPSSALGPGFAGAVKPDLLMPGAREHLRVVASGAGGAIRVSPGRPGRGAGLRVASPPSGQGLEGSESYTNGTSAATSIASRTAHRIHDALEAAYGDRFLQLPPRNRAALLKALLVHPARWPDATAAFVRRLLGPQGSGQASKQKDNIRRFVGYGPVDADEAVACAGDRATFWATGEVGPEQRVPISIPIPAAYGGKPRPHSFSATLAWFTPVVAARRSYRSVRMKILDPDGIAQLSVKAHPDQPDFNQTNRGTVYTRSWRGEKAAIVTAEMTIPLWIQREPDQGERLDESVTFGLAVTIAMPGVTEIYEQVRDRLRDEQRAPAR